jgi:succinate-acetate transporter protein
VNLTPVIAFALLGVVLLLAGLANIAGGDTSATLTKVAGYAGLLDGVDDFWLAAGILVNVMYGKEMLLLGAPRG